jgi:hypothetical protein
MIHLVRDVLDKQLTAASDGQPMGTADDIALELRDGQPPRVMMVESGLPAMARQIHPRLERCVRAIGRKIGVRRGQIYRIPWTRIETEGIDVRVRLDAESSPATAWERWLRQRIFCHIPGGKGK